MTQVTQQSILDVLENVIDPDKGKDIVSLGMVSGLQVKDGHVAFAIEVDPERGAKLEPLRKEAEKTVHDLAGVLSVTVVLTAETASSGGAPAHDHDHDHDHGGDDEEAPLLPDVAAIVAVASGKGGVGKSTVAVNLALAMAADGMKVGLLDADIYGPSMPRMLGVEGEPTSSDGRSLNAVDKHGIKSMSMGYLVEEETPIIWRGPMVMGALEQFMRNVHWGPLDVLVVDMPPGTGDAQLTMAQSVPLDGAVIVSTPQDIALADARKGLNMFRKVDVPVFGLIENMSYFTCPHCGERTAIFDHGGARREAEVLMVDFLGEIPLDPQIRETSDGGNPIVVAEPESDHSRVFREIAGRIRAKLDERKSEGADAGPRIVVQ